MNPASVLAGGCTCCVCTFMIVIPVWVMWRSVDGIVNDGVHWRRWNRTVHAADYACRLDEPAVCCPCHEFKYGHCCVHVRGSLGSAGVKRVCMRSFCRPTNERKWWNLVGIAFSLLFEVTAAVWLGCVLVHSCKQKSYARALRRCCGCRTEEDRAAAHAVTHGSTALGTANGQQQAVSVIDLDNDSAHIHNANDVIQLDTNGRLLRNTLPPLHIQPQPSL